MALVRVASTTGADSDPEEKGGTTMSDTAQHPSGNTPEAGRPDWRVEYAYTAGVQAFIYGFPFGAWRCPAVSRVDVNVHASTS